MLTYSIKFLVYSISKARYKNEQDIWQYVYPKNSCSLTKRWKDFSDYKKMSLALDSETQNFLDLESISKKWQNINSIEKSEKFEKQQENTTQTQNQSLFNSQKEQENIMVQKLIKKKNKEILILKLLMKTLKILELNFDHLINIFK